MEEMKFFVFFILLSMNVIGCLISWGDTEKICIIILTIGVCTGIKGLKKISFRKTIMSAGGILVGIIICSSLLFFFEYKELPISHCRNTQKSENTAVLVVFLGEPQNYDLSIFIKNFRREYKSFFIPMKLFEHKRIYEKIGFSNYTDMSRRIGMKLSEHLDNGYDVYISYLNNQPYYKEVIGQKILKRNYKKMIVVPVFYTESKDYKYIVSDLGIEQFTKKDQKIQYMTPLFNSDRMVQAMVTQICGMEPNQGEIGILIIGENFKNGLETSAMKQENILTKKLKEMFMNSGVEERKIKVMAAGEKENIKSKIEQLQQYGVLKIMIISIEDVIGKMEDAFHAHKWMDHFKETEFEYINGLQDEEALVEELEYQIRLMNVE